jgi:diguanylate cyclase (GGDEF)-like protein/PAS domain S-box-containing protein
MSEYADIIINAMRPSIIILDKNLRIVTANDSFYTFFKVKCENTIGYLIYELDNKQWDIPALREMLQTILTQKTSFNDYLVEHEFPNIGRRIMMMNARQIEQVDGRELIILLSMEDVTERVGELVIAKEEKEHLQQKVKHAAIVFSHTKESIMITDAAGTITEVNNAFSRITGYPPKDVLGENSRILQSGLESPEFLSERLDTLQTVGHWRGEVWNRRKNGQIFPAILSISGVRDADGLAQQYISLFTDFSSLKRSQGQGQLDRMSHYDPITNLPNLELVTDRITQSIVQCQRSSRSLTVAYMDLDGFKYVNDKYGHKFGDELLIAVSQQMQAALREGDTLARVGGDEFIAVLINLEKPEDSLPIIKSLLKAATNPITVGDVVMQVSMSIGIAFYPQDGEAVDTLIRHANQAMYVAKQTGKNRYHLFDTAQDNVINKQQKSIDDVRTAMASNEFLLHYQPKVNMQTGEVVGVEALIRWQHSVRGLVPPVDFLPVIEGHAISLELGEWVIGTALSQIIQWRSMGINLPISVNISAYQLQQSNFTTRLAALLAVHPEVDPNCLEIEILETSALHDISQVTATMNACHELGVHFALDDFGTGYSSLTYLRRLPAHLIKIDQTFVRDMLENADDSAIVEAVIGLAKAFRRDVIAEGVETIPHGLALLKLGCQLAQGYGIARPMPAIDIPKWVSNWKADDSWQI